MSTIATLGVRLGLDNSPFKKGLSSSLNDAKGFANKASGMLKTAAIGVLAGGATALAGITAGVGAGVVAMANDTQNAIANVESQLGIVGTESEKLIDISKKVWSDNYAANVDEASQAVIETKQILKDIPTSGIENATKKAIALKDTFGVDTKQSLSAAQTLMDDFGLSSGEAFDFITSGFQKGLDRSGDFLDSVGEYSTQFSNADATAGEFFSLMETGLQGGMLGTDRAADAFKEFRVRIQDGSATTNKALEQLGIPIDEFLNKLDSGEITATEAFGTVIQKIRETDNESIKMQAGVGLIGTQFEDLGTKAVENLDLTSIKMGDLEGSANSLNKRYNTFGSLLEGIKRKTMTGLQPLVDMALRLGNSIMPTLERGAENFATAMQSIFGVITGDLSDIEALQSLKSVFNEKTAQTILNISTAIKGFFERIKEGASVSSNIAATVGEIVTALTGSKEKGQEWANTLTSIFNRVGQAIQWARDNSELLKGAIAGIGAVIAAAGVIGAITSLIGTIALLASPIGVIIGLAALLGIAWTQNWGGIQEKTAVAIEFIKSAINTGVQFITAIWETHGANVISIFESFWGLLSGIVTLTLDMVSDYMDAFTAARAGNWKEFGKIMRDVWDKTWGKIISAINEALPKIVEAISGLVESGKAAFTSTDWSQVGRDIINGVISGIGSAGGALADAARGAASNAFDAMTGFFQNRSPSKKTFKMAGDVMQGMIKRFEKDNELIKAAQRMSENVANSLQPTPSYNMQSVTSGRVAGQSINIEINVGEIKDEVDMDILAYRISRIIEEKQKSQ